MFSGCTVRTRATRSCSSKHRSPSLLQTYRSLQSSLPSWSPRVLSRRFSLRAGQRQHALPSAPSVLTRHRRRRSGSVRALTSTATNTEERVPAASPAVVSALRTTLVLWTRGCQVQPWWKLWTLHWRGTTVRKRRPCPFKVSTSPLSRSKTRRKGLRAAPRRMSPRNKKKTYQRRTKLPGSDWQRH